MNKALNIFLSPNAQKFFIALLVTVVLFVLLFFFLSAFNLYKEIVRGKSEINTERLVYKFRPNTLALDYDEPSDTSFVKDDANDIKEQFLSYGVSYGIDVSEWQGDIDWKKVASTGISFAIIRCGFRYIESNELGEDANFKKNIEGAIDAGLKVGVYFYGTAINKKEAIEEANYTINLIKDYTLSYPVVYDAETFDRGRLEGVSYSTITENILTFMDEIESYGYASMVYSNSSAFYDRLDTGKFDSRLLWLAHYIDKTDYKGNYNMWQYADNGSVSGISGNVDLNVSYFKYVDNTSEIVANPKDKEFEIQFDTVDEEVYTTKTVDLRTSPDLSLPNRITTVPYGQHLKRVGFNKKISKIVYNGRIVYVDTNALAKV